MWTASSRPVSWTSDLVVQTPAEWQVAQPASDVPDGRIGYSRNFGSDQPHFFFHSSACFSSFGLWPARVKSVARSRPPWQTVQPYCVYECGEPSPTYVSR